MSLGGFRRAGSSKAKEMKKIYKSNPSKYLIIMGGLLLIYLVFFIRGMMLFDKVPNIDEGRIVILSTLIGSFVLIIISIIVTINGNYRKAVVLTPVYCEFSKGSIHFTTHWRDLTYYKSNFLGYKCMSFNGVIPDSKGNRKDIRVYIDSVFFSQYDEILKITIAAKKKVGESPIDI